MSLHGPLMVYGLPEVEKHCTNAIIILKNNDNKYSI